jgi:hypothetical protein
MPATITLADLNRQNREFWNARQLLRERRMADGAIREIAFDVMRDETKRGIPIKLQKSIYVALEYAENANQRFFSERGRKSGLAKKIDALQELIEEFVQREPGLTEPQLLAKSQQHVCCIPLVSLRDVVLSDNMEIRSQPEALGARC